MDIEFETVLRRYQERLTALMHANVMLECQVEKLQMQLDETTHSESEKVPQGNGRVHVEPAELLVQPSDVRPAPTP